MDSITTDQRNRSISAGVHNAEVGDTIFTPDGGSILGRYIAPNTGSIISKVDRPGRRFQVAAAPGTWISVNDVAGLRPRIVKPEMQQPNLLPQASEQATLVPDMVDRERIVQAIRAFGETHVPAGYRHYVEHLIDALPRAERSFSINVRVGVTAEDEATAVSRVREALASLDVVDVAVENQ